VTNELAKRAGIGAISRRARLRRVASDRRRLPNRRRELLMVMKARQAQKLNLGEEDRGGQKLTSRRQARPQIGGRFDGSCKHPAYEGRLHSCHRIARPRKVVHQFAPLDAAASLGVIPKIQGVPLFGSCFSRSAMIQKHDLNTFRLTAPTDVLHSICHTRYLIDLIGSSDCARLRANCGSGASS